MAIFEVQGPDGKIYEVDAPSMEEAAAAVGSVAPARAGGKANKPAIDDFNARMTTLGANVANGMAFGLGDEFEGAKAGVKNVVTGGDYLPAYRKERDAVRADMATLREAYPAAATAGNIAGSTLPALASAPAAIGKTMWGTTVRGGGLGALEGMLQGAGNADGRGMAGETLRGGLVGLGAGVAAPAIVGLGALAKRGALEGLPTMFGKAVRSKADRAMADAVARSGKTTADLDALLAAAKAAGQPEFRLADALGLPGQRALNGMARAGGAPGDEVAEFLATRQAGQGDRVGAFVEDAFGVKGTTAAKTKDSLTAARSAAADTAYDAARGNAAPVDIRDALKVIDDRIGGMQGSGVTGDAIDGKLAGYRSRLAAQPGPDGVMRELSDFDRVLGVKQAIQDDIGAAVRAGRNNEARELGKLVKELDAALEMSSDMYRTANDGFRAASKVIDAVDEGAMMATRGRAADNVPRFGAMAAAERDAARTGYGDRLLEALEKVAAPTSNRAKPLLSPKRAEEAGAMAIDPDLYKARLGRENAMWETQNRALGGSQTANNLADMQAMEGLAGGVLGAGKSAANFQIGDALSRLATTFAPLLKGQNEATRRLIVQGLLSGDAKALVPVIAKAKTSAKLRRGLEAILRQPIREGSGG